MSRFLAYLVCGLIFLSASAIAGEDHAEVDESQVKGSGRRATAIPRTDITREEQKKIAKLLGEKPNEKDGSIISEFLDSLVPPVFIAAGDPTPASLRIANERQKAAVRQVILDAKKDGKLVLVGSAMFKMMDGLGEKEGRKNRKAVLEVLESLTKARIITPAEAREVIIGDVRAALTSTKGHYASWARNDSTYFESTYDEVARIGLQFSGYTARVGGWYVYGYLHDKNQHRNAAAWATALGTVRGAENLLNNAELRRQGYFR